MARKLEVEIFASVLGYTKSLTKAAEQTKLFARSVDDSSKHIGRSLAFATGGFVAFAGATDFLKSSIDAARGAGVAQRQLAAQMKASGESFTQNKTAIDKAGLSLERFGFTSEDSAHALTVLERGTGKITRAISLQGVAANLARAKNLDLADAANILAKVFGGQETALRRAVPGLNKHAHGLELIAQAQQKLSGQAAAGTTVAERFQATLHDTEVIVGTALLPTLNKLLTSLGGWLDKMNRSGRLQKDVNEAVKTGTQIMQGILAVVRPLIKAFKDLGDAVGGTKNEVELLVTAFATFKAVKYAGDLGLIGSAAKSSSGKVDGLTGALGRLKAIGTIVIPVVIAEAILQSSQYKKSKSWVDRNLGPAAALFSGPKDIYKALATSFGNVFSYLGGQKGASPGGSSVYGPPVPPGLVYGPPAPGVLRGMPGKLGGTGLFNRPLSAMQQLRIGLAGDPSNLGLLRQLAAHDTAALAFAQKLRSRNRITNAKYVQEVTGYASELQQTNSTISGILQAAAATAKGTADQRKQAAIDTRMGWLNFGIERAGATKTIKDDVKAYTALENFLKQRIKQEGRTLDLVKQLWEARQAVRDLNKQKSAAAGNRDPLAGLFQVPTAQLTNILAKGTGLGVHGRQALSRNIAGAELQPIHVHVNIDGREVATAVAKQDARGARRTARQTSGYRG